MINNTAVFLVDLDSILDTRLALLKDMLANDELLNMLIGYRDRIYDRPDGLDYDLYLDRYSKRDRSLLPNSLVTEIPAMLSEMCMTLQKSYGVGPFNQVPKIVLNFYPYELNDSEKAIIISSFIESSVFNGVEVDHVYMNNAELTPHKLIDMNVTVYISYNAEAWIADHGALGTFDTQGCPGITLFAPLLITKETDDLDALLKTTVDGHSVFEVMEKSMSPLIRFKYLSAARFSAKILGHQDQH